MRRGSSVWSVKRPASQVCRLASAPVDRAVEPTVIERPRQPTGPESGVIATANHAEGTRWRSGKLRDQVEATITSEREHPTLQRLEDQIAWYDRKSQTAQRRYKVLKLVQVSIAALIPLASALPIPPPEFKWVTAILGLIVLVIEALQQLNQDQQNWIAYRSTCESLKHEKYLYLAGAGPYTNAEDKEKRLVLLADRIEGLISQEHAKWVSTHEQAATKNTAAGRNSTQAESGGQHSGG